MTNTMISPEDQPRNAVTAATRAAALVTAAFGGARRAAEDLAADRAGTPVTNRAIRRVDLSTPAGRIRHGYLGRQARDAIADLFEALDEVDTASWPLGLVASREAARQALRLSALAEDEQLPDCPTCDVAAVLVGDIAQTLRSANVGQAAALKPMRGEL